MVRKKKEERNKRKRKIEREKRKKEKERKNERRPKTNCVLYMIIVINLFIFSSFDC